jgi:hypothetical protein
MLSRMGPDGQTLTVELHFGADLAACGVLDGLQAYLRSAAPGYCSALRVLRYEGDRDAVVVDVSRDGELREAVLAQGGHRGETYQALAAHDPPAYPRRFGSALIYGADRSMYLSACFDEYVPAKPVGDKWLFSNSISAHIDSAAVGHRPRRDWALAMLTELGADPRLLWGASFLDAEFRAKNLHDGPDGVWALGRDVRVSLPGVFWANLFGTPYIDLIGRDRLCHAPAPALNVGKNVLVTVHEQPEQWAMASAATQNRLVAEHLGPHYFFDRSAPDGPTTAPDFGLQPLPARCPFQVFTPDGDHVTPLP